MIVGVPKEIKNNEFRVALVPSGVRALCDAGHEVLVEKVAGEGSGFTDGDFQEAGAKVVGTPAEAYSADLVVKVKEPQPEEYGFFRDGLLLFTFLHLVSKKALAEALIKNRVTAVAYETLEEPGLGLPILKPMSEIAGQLAVLVGANYLLRPSGGRGVLLGGVSGVEHGKVLIIGAGIVGVNAARVAVGLGAETIVIDRDVEKLRRIEEAFGKGGGSSGCLKTLVSNSHNIEAAVRECHILIGAVHSPGARTPTIVTRELVGQMKKGAVIVDVAVDQGGCVETIRPTTHSDPVYEVDGVLHYGVTNMPGSVPRTSTFALTNAALPYLLRLAELGASATLVDGPIRSGVNTHEGRVTNRAVATALGYEFHPLPPIKNRLNP